MSATEQANDDQPRYTVTQRPAALGGGWSLKLYLGKEEMGGGVFPPDEAAESPEQALIWGSTPKPAEFVQKISS